MIRLYCFVIFCLLLAGCASHPSSSIHKSQPIDRPIYLRGVFTWWDAEPQYQLHPVSGKHGVWMTQAQLMADGRPYEWKIGDKDWNCGTDFGYLLDDKPMILDKPRKADSCAEFNSFKFTPEKDGVYQFFLDINGTYPHVYIKMKPEE
ncbi:MAG: hypothetical protein CENE_01370 [Candidatus Celerinatantimonas neptuna]|nr:MAG: hypothetical protein CENE_01370 [Candidatus Celerinatantimonas neptuna]